jgi:steroid 5-alpha reductase family enzyme
MKSSQQDIRLTTSVLIGVLIIVSLVVISVGVNSVDINGYSSIVCCALIAFGIQFLAWIPASLRQTEKFYDITGGLTYLAVIVFSLWAGAQTESPSPRELIISILVAIWALRLSSFLFLRIHRAGKDGRFDDLKTSPIRFLVPWTLQGLWVFLTVNVVIVINSQSGQAPPLGIWDVIGLTVWFLGFFIEVIADYQKTSFNGKLENQGRWIDSGLWSLSRHPNYLGEILIWSGIACFGVSCFTGFEMLAWISPIFVYFLLTKISGVPILDKRSLEKWESNPEFMQYRAKTPALFPRIRFSKK